MKRSMIIVLTIALLVAFTATSLGFTSIAVSSIKLSSADVKIQAGKTFTLKVTITPANATNKKLTFLSGNNSIATVDANGKIKGIKPGKTVITVTSASNKKAAAKCNVTVSQAAAAKPVKITVAKVNVGNNNGKVYKNEKTLQKYAELTGVSAEFYTNLAGTGAQWAESFRLNIAANEIPDLIGWVPSEIVETMISNKMAFALDEALPKYAPGTYAAYTKQDLEAMRRGSDDRKIYYLPSTGLPDRCGLIRKDWLDKLGLGVPTTQDEMLNVLRAFKNRDPNGNGKADEIPTVGRKGGRWVDWVFAMYGVAMFEGVPEWDIYNGKIQYAGITPNMKAAIVFLKQLYDEGLLDPEFIVQGSDQEKLYNDRIGMWFHLPGTLQKRIDNIKAVNPKVNIVYQPVPKVKGYTGFYTLKDYNQANWMVTKQGGKKIEAIMKFIDIAFSKDPKVVEFLDWGLEGIHYKVENGQKVWLLADQMKEQTPAYINGRAATREESDKITLTQTDGAMIKAIQDKFYDTPGEYRKIAGSGMPPSVYKGYPEIRDHTLYLQFMNKVVLGEESIANFDKYVQQWYDNGGKVVTERMQKWYGK